MQTCSTRCLQQSKPRCVSLPCVSHLWKVNERLFPWIQPVRLCAHLPMWCVSDSCEKTEGGCEQQWHRHRYSVTRRRTLNGAGSRPLFSFLIVGVLHQFEHSCRTTLTPVQQTTREGRRSISLPAMATKASVRHCHDYVLSAATSFTAFTSCGGLPCINSANVAEPRRWSQSARQPGEHPPASG